MKAWISLSVVAGSLIALRQLAFVLLNFNPLKVPGSLESGFSSWNVLVLGLMMVP